MRRHFLAVAGAVSAVVWAQVAYAEAAGRKAALDALVRRADAARSDGLVVWQNGKLVGEWHFGRADIPIETMSVTKSVVSLAIGRLIDQGKLPSLDAPIYQFFPAWKQGRKQQISLRHLLNHTSGVQVDPGNAEELFGAPDAVALALAAELDAPPGAQFQYNNKAVNLLAGIVQTVAGRPLDAFVRDELLLPLGITDWSWQKDRAGNPYVMSGLHLRAADLAKIGQLLADDGVWQGRRLLSHAWIAESTAKPGQALARDCALLWWLVPSQRRYVLDDAVFASWRQEGMDEPFLTRLLPMKGRQLERTPFFAEIARLLDDPTLASWRAHTIEKNRIESKVLVGPTVGFAANGANGQRLVVLPKERVVAARLLAVADGSDTSKLDAMPDFEDLVLAFARKN